MKKESKCGLSGRRAFLAGATGGLAAPLAFTRLAHGQDRSYPMRPVRVINAYSAGGPADIVCRVLCARLSQVLGQQFVVENRPGAAGTVAAAVAARSAGDGYTLFYDATAHTVNPSLFGPRLSYDTRRDLLPVFLSMIVPNTILVANNVPIRSVPELIAAAKAAPGKLDCSTTGVGAGPHLSLELFKYIAGLEINHVVYRDISAAQNDLVAGRVPLQFSNVIASVPHLQAGTAKVIAHSGPVGPVKVLPDVPAIAETLVGFETYEWNGFFAPAGTPGELIQMLNTELNAAVRNPATVERLDGIGATTRPNTVEEFAAFREQQFELHARVVREANIRID
ncbi:Bug family tripartite tricarboxylate transporter substrate binding protein [Roseomonas sp. GCM10028921]